MKHYGFNFNDLFLLEDYYYEDFEIINLYNIPSLEDFHLSQSFQKLKNEEYLVEDPNDNSKTIISVKGKYVFEDLISSSEPFYIEGENIGMSLIIVNYDKTPEEKFEEWWKAFPTSPAWESDDGTKFIGSRTLKNMRKPIAKKAYLKLLNQGYKHEELLGSLKYEIKLKKLDSVKKNENQMDYFKGMESYLNSGRFSLYVEPYNQNPRFIEDMQDIKSRKKNVKDI